MLFVVHLHMLVSLNGYQCKLVLQFSINTHRQQLVFMSVSKSIHSEALPVAYETRNEYTVPHVIYQDIHFIYYEYLHPL
jgi:hypothetical protein